MRRRHGVAGFVEILSLLELIGAKMGHFSFAPRFGKSYDAIRCAGLFRSVIAISGIDMRLLTVAASICTILLSVGHAQDDLHKGNWLAWRGPLQSGVSLEKFESYSFSGEPLWTDTISGRGTPLVFDGRLYTWGYRGQGADLVEVLQARDEETGDVIWEQEKSDFISDTIYNRYSIGAPAIDPETGNVIVATTFGLVTCYDKDGEIQWEHSMIERFGRLTFPNGRAGAPVIDGDLVIIRGVTSYWGADGPARDRFFGFDKKTGDLIWSSTPGVGPPFLKDTSMSTPFLETRGGKRVFYVGTGCGNIACVNVKNGKALWRYQVSMGGVNSSPIILGDTLLCVHGKENLDTTEMGRAFAINLPEDFDNPGASEDPAGGAPRLPATVEKWRNPIEMFTSSPTLYDGRMYQMNKSGTLFCVDAETGKTLWEEKLANSQLHASPLYADGRLFVTTFPGELIILNVTGDEPVIEEKVELEGNAIGSPAICNGRLYVHTTEKLYCYQICPKEGVSWDDAPVDALPETGAAAALAAVPADVLLRSGEEMTVAVRQVDAVGLPVSDADAVSWETFVPPTARVKAKMDASFEGNTISAGDDATLSAGAWKATSGDLSGILRGRVIADLPYTEDFESFTIGEEGFAFPPLPWIGARLKWVVKEHEGNKVLEKTLDRVLFQRSLSFIGHPDESDYTVQADVMTDGSRRIKSVVGLINQRYLIYLDGNKRVLEVNSNHERLKQSVPFSMSANKWYTLKTRVDIAEDGSGVIRAKAWEKGTDEPEAWTIEVEHANAHAKGAPGLYGFSPQSQKTVFIDNISIVPNEAE